MPEVYLAKNRVTGKCYVGFTSRTARERWRGHVSDARVEVGCRRLRNSIRKHGPEAFTVSILHQVETAEEAKRLEQRCIRKLGTGRR